MESTAKIFQNGRSQAVRLPKAFRFKAKEVKIRKEGEMTPKHVLKIRVAKYEKNYNEKKK